MLRVHLQETNRALHQVCLSYKGDGHSHFGNSTTSKIHTLTANLFVNVSPSAAISSGNFHNLLGCLCVVVPFPSYSLLNMFSEACFPFFNGTICTLEQMNFCACTRSLVNSTYVDVNSSV